MYVDDDIINIYLKYKDDKEAFIKAYVEYKSCNKNIYDKDKIDATQCLSEMLSNEIDKQIVAELVWLGKDNIKMELRKRKLKRIL